MIILFLALSILSNVALGKTRSILTDLEALSNFFETMTVFAVDQPLPIKLYQALLNASTKDHSAIVAPIFREESAIPYFLVNLYYLISEISQKPARD